MPEFHSEILNENFEFRGISSEAKNHDEELKKKKEACARPGVDRFCNNCRTPACENHPDHQKWKDAERIEIHV
jgi:hypothetical protein